MNKCTFSSQTGKAYYCNSIKDFIIDDSKAIIGELVNGANKDSHRDVPPKQIDAWNNQIKELQSRLEECCMTGCIIFEYDIIRLGKRIDVILLIKHMVFSLEFKNGKTAFVVQDAQQAEDYAIDIKNFHKESADLYVCPILIATKAPKYKKPQSIDCYPDKQVYLQRENIETFTPKILSIADKYGDDRKINFKNWFDSPYHPTPTIIAAAVEAYLSNDISQIAQSEAGQDNIDRCEQEIGRIVDYARNNHKKCVCFVTGVPGAGKTLVGLNVVAKNLKKGNDNLSVYLSGNDTLVKVLREALTKSAREKNTLESKDDRRFNEKSIKLLIQSSYDFKKAYAEDSTKIPEHILIFDEAQRVWNKERMTKKHEKNPYLSVSESHLFFKIMNRHKDWAVMICLVGLGQDIHDGEVGINEWFRCGIGIEEFKDWEMYYSPAIFSQVEDTDIDRDLIMGCDRCHQADALHLRTSIRSFRADKQSQFVDALLDNRPEEAKEVYSSIKSKYPIYITRDINAAKKWAKGKVRGSQRCGVLASSGAQRLKPYGVYIPSSNDFDAKNWYLAPSDDLRSSNMMEVVATEFKVQGLEIDWAVVCWDADLRRNADEWAHYNFRGTRWMRRNKDEQKRYLVNTYRVLLTRARQGMVIFVPEGVDEEEDATRNHEFYDEIYSYLLSCGIEELKQ